MSDSVRFVLFVTYQRTALRCLGVIPGTGGLPRRLDFELCVCCAGPCCARGGCRVCGWCIGGTGCGVMCVWCPGFKLVGSKCIPNHRISL